MQYTVYLLSSHSMLNKKLERKMLKALFNVKSGSVHSIEGNPVKCIFLPICNRRFLWLGTTHRPGTTLICLKKRTDQHTVKLNDL